MEINFKFQNKGQRDFYYSTARNQLFSGGFNNGKTFIGCFKAQTLLLTFPNYRMTINRQVYADLKKTTMQTFFKNLPEGFVKRHNEQDGYTELYNKSAIYWLHLDNVDESTLRGLEVNSNLTDQAEESEEKVADVLDGRIGRWDGAQVPQELLNQFEQQTGRSWPLSPTGKLVVPSYNMNLCNPDTQFHYLYRKYHPDSLERRKNYFYCEGEWDPNLGSKETYEEALTHDDEWVSKYVRGQWGISNAQIHRLNPKSLLEYSPELIDKIRRKGNLFRILDHGDASPTACLWMAVLDGNFIFYKEYYVPAQPISFHRQGISDLSQGEAYSGNYADPQIFKKTGQKDGSFWTTADEYLDKGIPGPPLSFIPADNNEFATRNRINELLKPSVQRKHPVTGEFGAPGIYFVKKSSDWPSGCYHGINELQSQRRKSLGYIDGKQIFCDDREDSVADHAYDCIRYGIAAHGLGKSAPKKSAPHNSIAYYKMMAKRKKMITAMSS